MYILQFNTSRIHPNSKKRDRDMSPSKDVTFLYVDTCLWIDSNKNGPNLEVYYHLIIKRVRIEAGAYEILS